MLPQRVHGRRLAADRRMCVEDLLLLVVRQCQRDLTRSTERVVEEREPLDEARTALEQLGELVDPQLPR